MKFLTMISNSYCFISTYMLKIFITIIYEASIPKAPPSLPKEKQTMKEHYWIYQKLLPVIKENSVKEKGIYKIIQFCNHIAIFFQNEGGHRGNNGNYDMSVKGAWQMGYTGKGVVVTILDDGIEHTHDDLKENYVSGEREREREREH